MTPDPRVTLARSDLAADSLEGLIKAERFAHPIAMQTIAPLAALRTEGRAGAEQADQLLFGEVFEVLEAKDGFAWGQARRDGYVGFVEAACLSSELLAPTHRIGAPSTFAFAEPSIRAAPFGPLSLNALVTVLEESGSFVRVAGAGWIPRRHLSPIGCFEADPATVAQSLVGAPYLWGGRSSLGLDCSGLIQQALHACGLACPRDTDQQSLLGVAIGPAEHRRGDLIFWRGHVGMMLDDQRLIHANAHRMAVAIEPLHEAIARIEASGAGPPTVRRRL
ncbi:MAG TPA: C40 family peptidase [Caulobacteraceae bacterium]